jgi:uncharacterized protein (DUF488 family)
MTIYTLGYQGWKIDAAEAVLLRLDAILVDVRMMPRSRLADFNGGRLQKRLGGRYVWLGEFGNRNYKGSFDQIEIVDFAAGEKRLRELCGAAPAPNETDRPASKAIVLLCGCADVNACHRKVLAERLAGLWGAQVVHLSP